MDRLIRLWRRLTLRKRWLSWEDLRVGDTLDWQCGHCGRLKSEIVTGKGACEGPPKGSTACPLWPIVR